MFITEDDFVNRLNKKVQAQKQVRYDIYKEGKDLFPSLYKYLHYYNLIDEFHHQVFHDTDFDDVPVCEEFVPFLIPKAVKFDVTNTSCIDLLARTDDYKKEMDLEGYAEKNDLNYSDWLDLQDELRGKFKLSLADKAVPLSTIKVEKSFNDVFSRASFVVDDKVLVKDQESTTFVPIRLNFNPNCFFKHYYCNTEEKFVVEKFLDHFRLERK